MRVVAAPDVLAARPVQANTSRSLDELVEVPSVVDGPSLATEAGEVGAALPALLAGRLPLPGEAVPAGEDGEGL